MPYVGNFKINVRETLGRYSIHWTLLNLDPTQKKWLESFCVTKELVVAVILYWATSNLVRLSDYCHVCFPSQQNFCLMKILLADTEIKSDSPRRAFQFWISCELLLRWDRNNWNKLP